jgi:hypothetical protein
MYTPAKFLLILAITYLFAVELMHMINQHAVLSSKPTPGTAAPYGRKNSRNSGRRPKSTMDAAVTSSCADKIAYTRVTNELRESLVKNASIISLVAAVASVFCCCCCCEYSFSSGDETFLGAKRELKVDPPRVDREIGCRRVCLHKPPGGPQIATKANAMKGTARR